MLIGLTGWVEGWLWLKRQPQRKVNWPSRFGYGRSYSNKGKVIQKSSSVPGFRTPFLRMKASYTHFIHSNYFSPMPFVCRIAGSLPWMFPIEKKYRRDADVIYWVQLIFHGPLFARGQSGSFHWFLDLTLSFVRYPPGSHWWRTAVSRSPRAVGNWFWWDLLTRI